ncbi:MAG: hypothetical protein ACHQHO_08860 [Solirubrobacterales bacterium]
MLLALPDLSREGISGNAHGCRQYPEALSLLSALRQAHELPRVVVIALGANGEITDSDVNRALKLLGRERLLVLVTPRELGGGAGSDAQLVRSEGRRHPQRVGVLDWVAYSSGHPEWFEPDGLHLSPSGSAALAALIGRVRPLAAPPTSVRPPKCSSSKSPTPMALTGVIVAPSGGGLSVHPDSSRLKITLLNANPFAVEGVAQLSEAVAGGRTIAATCISAPPGGPGAATLRLDAAALADLELRRRYRVRLEVSVSAPPNLSATVTDIYSLRQTPR